MDRNLPQLVLETSRDGDEVFIHANPTELRRLAKILERLAAKVEAGEPNHEHMFSESWGGHDLSQEQQTAEHRLVHHLKIYGWPIIGNATAHGT